MIQFYRGTRIEVMSHQQPETGELWWPRALVKGPVTNGKNAELTDDKRFDTKDEADGYVFRKAVRLINAGEKLAE